MSPVREVSLTALREIRRNLGSTKGIVMLVLFFLGGLVPSILKVLLDRAIDAAAETPVPEEAKQQLLEKGLAKFYDADAAQYLSKCPPLLYLLFQSTVIFAPLLILIISFDQIAGEIQHRSVRYVVGRSRRESFVVGKALGVWGIISLVILLLHSVVWVVMIASGTGNAGSVLTWGPKLWLFSAFASVAWVGITTLISSLFRTPIVALLVGVVVFPTVWLTNLILRAYPSSKPVTWAFPFRYEELLLSPHPQYVIGGAAAFVAWAAIMVGIATIIVKRRDV